jgi:hypothetical protein
MSSQPARTPPDPAGRTYDAVIVGSGASGGWVAKRLAEAGLRVVVLEAGRPLGDADYKEHVPAFALPYRGRTKRPFESTQPRQSNSYAVREWNADWFVNDIEEPYADDSDPDFLWVRTRVVGGRMNIWGRAALRMSDVDFKAASRDGAGVDWPLSYADLAPYYDMVEEYVGVSAMAEGLAQLPDGRFQPAMGLTCAEVTVRNRVKRALGHTLTQGRTANLTQALNGRQPCHYCGPCEHGCVTHSYFNSAFTTLADALKTGRCTLVTGAMAYQVLMDPETHRARGLLYVDRETREPREVYGRIVALCAQSLESVRILLNSASRQDANGLANSSGLVGTHLMTHFSDSGAQGELPDLVAAPTLGGADRPCSLLLVRFQNLPGGPAAKDFLRGYSFGTSVYPGFDPLAPRHRRGVPEGAARTAPGHRQPLGVRRVPALCGESRHDRSRGPRCLGDPRGEAAALAARQRARDGQGHGGARRGDPRGDRRQAHPAAERPARPGARGGHRPHGHGPEDVRADAVPADPRRRQPVRDGRLELPLLRLAEPDAHHHGARRPRHRSSARAPPPRRALGRDQV